MAHLATAHAKASYKHIFRSISLFGGVQVIQVFTTLIRGKFVAVFLGSAGLGVSSLLVSSIATIQAIFRFGLDFSAVREISKAKETEDLYKLSRTITVFIRWLLLSSFVGALVLVVAAPWLSDIAFGDDKYTQAFVWLSFVVAVNTMSAGCQSLLQGTRRLKDLAKVSVIGSVLTIVISAPIYYFWGVRGIVPSLILVSLMTFITNYYFAQKIELIKVHIGTGETIKEGSVMLKLGVAKMSSGLLGTAAAFLINAYIRNTGSLSDVGLYQAGLSISNKYVGIIFAAIAIDYFPRLAAVSSDPTRVRDMANQQSEIMLLIVTPILITMILTAPVLIGVLLTAEFLPVTDFIRLVSIGVFFQAAKQSMDYISFAKGDTQTFVLMSSAGSGLLLGSIVIGYTIGGLNGAAIMFIVHSIIIFSLIYFVTYKKYEYMMSRCFTGIFCISICLLVLVSALLIRIPNVLGYVLSGFLLCMSMTYSIYMLDKLIGLKESYKNFSRRFIRT